MAYSGFEELIQGLSKEELNGFNTLCKVLDFTSNLNVKSYTLDTINSVCSNLDTITTGSKIVFDQDIKTITIETAGKLV